VPKNGVPCSHAGCLSHVTHPCEGCGRIEGGRKVVVEKAELERLQRLVEHFKTWFPANFELAEIWLEEEIE
jgi:hypothetical protein